MLKNGILNKKLMHASEIIKYMFKIFEKIYLKFKFQKKPKI